MRTHLKIRKRLAPRFALLALVAGLAACSDDTTAPRITEPSTPSFGKNVTGTNQRLLFTSMRDGNEELYSMNPDGTGVTRLTFSAGEDAYGVWSPDGKRIAFFSQRDNPWGDIYLMNADGSGVVRLTNSVAMSVSPTWSKDGKQIAFASNRTSANPSVYNANDFEIFVVNVDGTGLKQITKNNFSDFAPVWSPDGKQIAFASNRDNYAGNDIFVMNVDGSQVTRLTPAEPGIHSGAPAWDPHGRTIVFQREGGLFVVDPTTRLQTQLTYFNGDMDPSYSPDGTQLAFTSIRDGYYDIFVMNSDGSNINRITDNLYIDWFVRWSR